MAGADGYVSSRSAAMSWSGPSAWLGPARTCSIRPSPTGFRCLRKDKHLLIDEKLIRLSPKEGWILAQVDVGRTSGRALLGREDGQELFLQHPGQA
jgi:hypothetical protein